MLDFLKKKNSAVGAGDGGPGFKIEKPVKKDAGAWAPSVVLETNLIHGDTSVNYDWRKYIRSLVANVIWASILVGAAYGGLVFWEKTGVRNQDLVTKKNNLEAEKVLLEKNVNEIDDFKKKLEMVSVLLDRHIYWDGFFAFMEKNLLNEVYIPDSFTGVPDGKYSFSAKTDSYGTMIDQILYLRSRPEVVSAKLSGANYDFGLNKVADKSASRASSSEEIEAANDAASALRRKYPVSFSVQLELDPMIFYKK